MLLQFGTSTPYDQLPPIVVNLIEPLLWWIGVGLFVITTIIFLKAYKKAEAGRQFLMGLVIFGSWFAAARAIENIRKFSFSADPIDISKGWLGLGPEIDGISLILRVIYYVLSWISIAIFYYTTEKNVFQKKSHYVLTVSALMEGAVSIGIYFTEGTARLVFLYLSAVGFLTCGVFPALMYFIIGKKSTGDIAKSCYIAGFGLIFFVLGVMIELPETMMIYYLGWGGLLLDAWLIAIVAPVCFIIGVIIVVYGYRKMFSFLF